MRRAAAPSHLPPEILSFCSACRALHFVTLRVEARHLIAHAMARVDVAGEALSLFLKRLLTERGAAASPNAPSQASPDARPEKRKPFV
eukprot:3218365-Pleurochrysis_carterae.AAC.2